MEAMEGWKQILILASYIGLYFVVKKFILGRFKRV